MEPNSLIVAEIPLSVPISSLGDATLVVIMLILFAATSTLPVVTNSTFVLIPLKSFVEAKFRLAEVMGEEERIDLAKKMAQIVVEAATPLPVAIVCDDEEVAAWAHEKGAEVIWADKSG